MINIIFDVDDVLNNLSTFAFQKHGLPLPHRYRIRECEQYTKEQQDAVLATLADPETFKLLDLQHGIDRLIELNEVPGARVGINTASFNSEIVEVKKVILDFVMSKLDPDMIFMPLINDGDKKANFDYTDIIVEDSMENILSYGRQVHKVLIDKTYNQAREYGIKDSDYGIHRVKTLDEAIDCIYDILKDPGVEL
jgi:hypothetical protein